MPSPRGKGMGPTVRPLGGGRIRSDYGRRDELDKNPGRSIEWRLLDVRKSGVRRAEDEDDPERARFIEEYLRLKGWKR